MATPADTQAENLPLAPAFDLPGSGLELVVGTYEDYNMGALGAEPNNRSQTYFNAAKTSAGFGKDEYRTLVNLCRDIFHDEGIINQWVLLQLGMASMGMENKFKREVADRYRVVFNSFAGRVNEKIAGKTAGLDEFQRRFCYEYYTSGMICSLETTGPMRVTIGSRGTPVTVPIEMDILDPTLLDLDDLYTTGLVKFELSQKDIDDIKKNGVKAAFVQTYPKTKQNIKVSSRLTPQEFTQADIVAQVVAGATSVPLPTGRYRLYRRVFDDYTLYPVPFLSGALVALGDKSMLREADRSVMRKLINMILHYKVGIYDPDGRRTNAGDDTITRVRTTFSDNLRRSKDGRLVINSSGTGHHAPRGGPPKRLHEFQVGR